MSIKAWWADLPTETLRETAWERGMSMSGVDAYEQARYTASGEIRAASESAAGQKLMRKTIAAATAAIEEMQLSLLELNRVDKALKGTVLLVPAETSALLTIRHLLDKTYATLEREEGANFQVCCKDVAKSIELELNFRNWLKQSKEAAKAYAASQGSKKVPKSMAERLIEGEGVSRASMYKWKKVFNDLNAYRWDSLEQHYCGEALVKTVVDALPECFEIATVFTKGKDEKVVRMTDTFRKQFNDIEHRVSQLQVIKKPMLTRPRRWTKEES